MKYSVETPRRLYNRRGLHGAFLGETTASLPLACLLFVEKLSSLRSLLSHKRMAQEFMIEKKTTTTTKKEFMIELKERKWLLNKDQILDTVSKDLFKE